MGDERRCLRIRGVPREDAYYLAGRQADRSEQQVGCEKQHEQQAEQDEADGRADFHSAQANELGYDLYKGLLQMPEIVEGTIR